MRLQHEYIAEIGDCGEIADHPGKADLHAATIINAKAQRMLDRSRHDFPRNSLRPIAIRQEPVNHIQIEAGRIGADEKLVRAGDRTWCIKSSADCIQPF